MKNTKKAIALMSAVAAAFSVFAGVTASAATVELIKNGTFDTDASNWDCNGGAVTYDSEKNRGSNTGRWNQWSGLLQEVSLEQGVTYTLSADMYAPEGACYSKAIAIVQGVGTITNEDGSKEENADGAFAQKDVVFENGQAHIDLEFTISDISKVNRWDNKEITVEKTRVIFQTDDTRTSDQTSEYTDEEKTQRNESYVNYGETSCYYLDNVSLTYQSNHATINGQNAVNPADGYRAEISGTVIEGLDENGNTATYVDSNGDTQDDKSTYAKVKLVAGDYQVTGIAVYGEDYKEFNLAAGSEAVVGIILNHFPWGNFSAVVRETAN